MIKWSTPMKHSINSPFVSVIMPAYNSERYISTSVKSILDQSYANFEFIIVDDASTDKTSKLLSQSKTKNFGLYRLRKSA